jgi:SOS response regulatory protein OraA/RecX
MGPKAREPSIREQQTIRTFDEPKKKPDESNTRDKSINVQPIKIMIVTNVMGQKDPIPFTKALIYHPDFPNFSKSESLNEYPYISDNVSIESIFNDFNTTDYSTILQFFFDKKTFVSKLMSSRQSLDIIDDNKTEEKNAMLEKNFKEMLRLLFPTAVPFTDNLNISYEDYLEKSTKLPSVSYRTMMEYFKVYKLSFLSINGKEYTISSVTWLNDVLNHPGYSTLFEKFKEYRTWSATMTKKLKKKKIELFLSMVTACANETKNEDCQSNGKPPNIDNFDKSGIYADTYIKARNERKRIDKQKLLGASNVLVGEDLNISGKLEEIQKVIRYLGRVGWENSTASKKHNCPARQNEKTPAEIDGEIINKAEFEKLKQSIRGLPDLDALPTPEQKKQFETIFGKIQSIVDTIGGYVSLSDVAYKDLYINKDDEYKKSMAVIKSKLNTLLPIIENALSAARKSENLENRNTEAETKHINALIKEYKSTINQPYSEMMKTLDTSSDYSMKTIQASVDTLKISELKILHDELNKRGLFSNRFRDFVSNLSALYEKTLEIDIIWNRMNNNTFYSEKPLPPEYSKITSMMKELNEYESSTRESTNIQFQKIIDEYISKKGDKSSDIDIDKFTGKIVKFKGSKNRGEVDKKFEVGLIRLQNSSEPSVVNFEAFVRLDLFGGVLNLDNIEVASCMFQDKKLSTDLRNIRNKITLPEWQVRPGHFINLPKNAPKTQTTRRRANSIGGANKTRKRSSIRRK